MAAKAVVTQLPWACGLHPLTWAGLQAHIPREMLSAPSSAFGVEHKGSKKPPRTLAPFPARSPDPSTQWPHFMTHMELSPLGYKSLQAGTSLAHSRLHLQVPGRRSQVSAHSQHLPSCFQGARAIRAPPNALHLDHLHVLSVAPRPPCPDSSHPLPSHVFHCPPHYLRAMCTSWDVPSLLLSLSLCTCCFGLECPPSRYLLDSHHSLCPHLCQKSLLLKEQTLWSPLPICPYPFIFLW